MTEQAVALTDPRLEAARSLPVNVWVGEDRLRQPLLAAISLWNTALGADVFRYVADKAEATIKVRVDKTGEVSGGLGGSGILKIGPTVADSDSGWVTALFAHELGHNLGLEHTFAGAPNEYDPGSPLPNTNLAGIMGDGRVILGYEAARVGHLYGMTKDQSNDPSLSTGNPNEGVGKALARFPLPGTIEGPAPFASFNERIRAETKTPQQKAAAALVFSGMVNRWGVPGGEGVVGWRPEAAHYTYEHYVSDVSRVAHDVFGATEAPVEKGGAPSGTPAAKRARQIQ